MWTFTSYSRLHHHFLPSLNIYFPPSRGRSGPTAPAVLYNKWVEGEVRALLVAAAELTLFISTLTHYLCGGWSDTRPGSCKPSRSPVRTSRKRHLTNKYRQRPALQHCSTDRGQHCSTAVRTAAAVVQVSVTPLGFLLILVRWCLSLVSSAPPINTASITSYLQTNLNKNNNKSPASSPSSPI